MPRSGPRSGALLVSAVALLAAGCAGVDPSPEELREDNPTQPCGELPAWELDERYDPRVRLDTSLGTVDLVIYYNEVPRTSISFLSLAEDGFYDGLRFHRIVEGFALYSGDPNSRSADRRDQWGFGSPGYLLDDEHHQFLRYRAPYQVALATGGPNTGGSQFFITLATAAGLDDRSPLFGRVIAGTAVVDAIARTPVWSEDDVEPGQEFLVDQPRQDVFLRRVTALPSPLESVVAPVGLAAAGVDCSDVIAPDAPAQLAFLVRNTGHRLLNTTWSADLPPGWTAELANTNDHFPVAAGQTAVLTFNVTAPATATGSSTLTFRFTGVGGGEASVPVTLAVVDQPAPVGGADEVRVDYIGMLDDGRVFDASEPAAFEGTLDTLRDRTTGLEPLECRIRAGAVECVTVTAQGATGFGPLIRGFSDAVLASRVDQASVVRVFPTEGYGTESQGNSGLGGRTLYYVVVPRQIG